MTKEQDSKNHLGSRRDLPRLFLFPGLCLVTLSLGLQFLAPASTLADQASPWNPVDPQNLSNPGNPEDSNYQDDYADEQTTLSTGGGTVDQAAEAGFSTGIGASGFINGNTSETAGLDNAMRAGSGLTPDYRRPQHGRGVRPWSAADESMYGQMHQAARWLQQYVQWNHRFPEQGEEMMNARRQIAQIIVENPYDNSGGDTIETAPGQIFPDQTIVQTDRPYPNKYMYDFAPNSDRIALILNQSMNYNMVVDWVETPPGEWVAAPGSIIAISNQQDLWILWGARADGLPLCDPVSGKTKIILGRFIGLNYSDF